jgi:glutamyl-tRNA reductase
LLKFSEDLELKHLKVIAFTHKQLDLKDLGSLVIEDEQLDERLLHIKESFDIPELFYIGTCNRVEFVFYSGHSLTPEFLREFLSKLNFHMSEDQIDSLLLKAVAYEGVEALRHLFRMSCSMESLVVGEKEILAQVRRAYERCKNSGFTGDFIRLMMDNLVRTAKEVYTYTQISRKPISVVSLAYRKLREYKLPENPRIIIVGAGETNQNVSKYLSGRKSLSAY